MRLTIAVLFGIFLLAPELLRSEWINRPVINIYLQPQEDAEVDSQAIYGDFVEVLQQFPGWSKLKMRDGVIGWALSSYLVCNPSFDEGGRLRPVQNLFAHVYRTSDVSSFPPLLTLPYGAKVKLDVGAETAERWVPIELVSGEKAWMQRGDIDFSPRRKVLKEVLSLSKRFLGLPYTWGGASSYGFDCSGFVQMLFKEMGLVLPRNARDQACCPFFIPVEGEDFLPGDLLFFGEKTIEHVGLYLGQGKFIHGAVLGNPVVMISRLEDRRPFLLAARRIDPPMVDIYSNSSKEISSGGNF